MKSNFFDHIYLVNLPQHRGRLLRALSHLKKYDIEPQVFKASDGYSPPLLNQYEKYVQLEPGSLVHFSKFNGLEKNRNKRFIESAGAYGYINTYIRVLKDAKAKGYRSILIFEDDVFLADNFDERLEGLLLALPENWKFISLGASQYNWASVDLDVAKSQGFYTPKQLDTCGSFAIAVSESIYDALIQLESYYEAPFDHLPLGEIYKQYPRQCFVAYPNMVMPDVRSSSIRGSRHQLVHAKNMKWEPHLFVYPPKRPIINLILSSREEVKYLDSFNDENTFPFELHIFIPSLDGLRPYHDVSQVIEVFDTGASITAPNSGFCVQASASGEPITENDFLSLYESLVSSGFPTENFKLFTTESQVVDTDRVSVIIPTYRRSEGLEKVILSVIEQDYQNKEILIVDDNHKGSEDQLATERVVLSLIKEHADTSIIYISQSRNRNGAGARNTGFLKSTGNYICFLDDDDLYLPNRLSKSIKKLEQSPRCVGAVYCGFIGWNGGARTSERYKKTNLTQELLTLDYLSHYLHTNTVTYKRDAVITINGFDETFRRHQDLEFNLRFFEYYEMTAVEQQLVSLRPEPTVINNQQFGINLFETKLKFLKKFQYIINRFDASTQKNIYDKHWGEVVNYVSNEKEFERYLSASFSNGHLQCYQILKKIESECVTKEQIDRKIKESSSRKKITQAKSQKVIPKKNHISNKVVLDEALVVGYEDLNYWQIKGVKVFALVFSKFILPPQKRKLRSDPNAFFSDSKNSLTRSIGKILKII